MIHSTNRLTIDPASTILNHMVENRLDATFKALADPTRRGMLASLALGEKSIGELAEPFAMSFAGASKHVKVLEDAGLIARRKQGRTHLIKIEAKPLEEAERWLRQWEKFWTVRLDRLEALIERDKKETKNG
jgi:DNA-binding transcriptional ArsR family regulator